MLHCLTKPYRLVLEHCFVEERELQRFFKQQAEGHGQQRKAFCSLARSLTVKRRLQHGWPLIPLPRFLRTTSRE
jgi:hypothetical protein